MNFSVPLNLNLNNLFQHWWTLCQRESLDSLSRASKQEKEVCQRGAECQAPAQLVCQQWDFSEELERITKSQQEWLPGGEKAGAGQRSRLEQSKRENSEARTLVTQANNSLSTNGNSPEPENTCLPQLWPFSTSRKFVTVPIASQENPCRVKYIYQLLWWTVLFFAPLLQS